MGETDVKEDLDHGRKDQFALNDEVFGLRWLPSEEAVTGVPAVFGLDGFLDNEGRLIWTFPSRACP